MAIKRDPEIVRQEQELVPAESRDMGAKAFLDSPIPDFMRSYKGGLGTEQIGADAVEVPRLLLTQALSPQVESGDARPSDWWHNVAEENLGRELLIVPCHCSLSAILFRPRSNGGGVLARTRDMQTWTPPNTTFEVELQSGKRVQWNTKATVAASGLIEWGTEDPSDPRSAPAATQFLNVVAYLVDHPDLSPVVLSFSRSSWKVGKKFMSQLKLARAPSFGCIYKLSSEKVEGQSGSYLEPRLKAQGLVKDESLFRTTENIYSTFKDLEFEPAGVAEEHAPTGEDAADY
jgi:hypothetical protein